MGSRWPQRTNRAPPPPERLEPLAESVDADEEDIEQRHHLCRQNQGMLVPRRRNRHRSYRARFHKGGLLEKQSRVWKHTKLKRLVARNIVNNGDRRKRPVGKMVVHQSRRNIGGK